MSDRKPGSGARSARGRPKAPRFTEWRGGVLHFRFRHPSGPNGLIRYSLRTSDVDAAATFAEAEAKRLRAPARDDATRVRYQDLFASWAADLVHQVGPRTAQRYGVSLGQLEPWLLDTYVDEIDRKLVRVIVAGRRAMGVSTATIKRDLVALGSLLKFGDVDDNPALGSLKSLKERRDPIVRPDPDHVRRIIARCPGRLGALAHASWLTGCRQEELVTAERSKLDHTRRQLTVRGKRNKLRTIDLSAEAYELLRALPAMLGCKWLFWHPVARIQAGPGAAAVERTVGEPFRNVSSRFAAVVSAEMAASRKRAAAAGHQEPDFRKFRFHDLRHDFAIGWLKARRSIYDLKEHLGHESVKTTEIYLAFLTGDEKRAVMYGEAGTVPESQNESQA